MPRERIALINPPPNLRTPGSAEPLALLELAAVLRENGAEPEIIDGAVQQITPDILSPYRIIAVTAATPQYLKATGILQMARQLDPKNPPRMIIGGPHVSAVRNSTLKDGWDGVCVGEGENVIADLIARRTSGLIIGSPVENLDVLPFPARDLSDPSKYIREGDDKPTISILGTRGCPYSCIYCAPDLVGKQVRYRSPSLIAAEIKDAITKYGISKVFFYDDTFTANRQRTLKLCSLLKELGIKWSCNTRVNKVDPTVLRAMKEAGCQEIAYGVESAAQEVLDLAHKKTTVAQAHEAIIMTKDVGIPVRVFFMFGFPNDSFETARKMIKFIETANPNTVRLSVVTPFPGTALYNNASQYGITLPPDGQWNKYQYIGPDGTYTFKHGVTRGNFSETDIGPTIVDHTDLLNPSQFQATLAYLQSNMAKWAIAGENQGALVTTGVL